MKYKIKYKPKSIMGDYIALHSDVPWVRLDIPKDEIWIRKDIHDNNPERARRIQLHEFREIKLMENGDSYKKAHRKAGY